MENSIDTIFYVNEKMYELIKWKSDNKVEIEYDDRILYVDMNYFMELYKSRDK